MLCRPADSMAKRFYIPPEILDACTFRPKRAFFILWLGEKLSASNGELAQCMAFRWEESTGKRHTGRAYVLVSNLISIDVESTAATQVKDQSLSHSVFTSETPIPNPLVSVDFKLQSRRNTT
jgi:hypothetical protein